MHSRAWRMLDAYGCTTAVYVCRYAKYCADKICKIASSNSVGTGVYEVHLPLLGRNVLHDVAHWA